MDAVMNPPVGFVILSHAELAPLERLVAALNRAYDDPPIAIHHDFSQSNIDVSQLKGNVRFVRPHLRTRWGQVSAIRATLSALRMLYEKNEPEWFTLLSAADYPIMPSGQVVKELFAEHFDLYMDYQLVERRPNPQHDNPESRMAVAKPDWRANAYDRYMAKTIMLPPFIIDERKRRPFIIRSGLLLRPFLPYSSHWKCYAGDHWFTGNRKVANILLCETSDIRRTLKHLSGRFAADESFYQTVLANQPDIRICKDNKRYAHWVGQDAHPKTLEIGDLHSILASRCHFARKFSTERPSRLLDELDRIIDA